MQKIRLFTVGVVAGLVVYLCPFGATGQNLGAFGGIVISSPVDQINQLANVAAGDAARVESLWRHWQSRVSMDRRQAQNPDLRRAVLQATCYSGKVYGYLHLAKRIRDQEIASLNSELGRCMRGADQAVMLDPGCQELVRDGGRQYKKALNQSVNRLEGLASQASNGSKAIGFMYTSINRLGQTFWIAQRDAGDLGTRLVIGGTSSSADRSMRAALTGAAMAAITEEPFDSMSEMRPGQLPMTCEDF